MTTDVWTYSKLLAEQLRINGVREFKVREIVAQVQEHHLSTGQDPVEAFGQPVDYARSWRPLRWTSWLIRLVALCAGWAGLMAVFAAILPITPTAWTQDLDITAASMALGAGWAAGSVLVWTLGFWMSRQRARSLGHPRRERLVRAASVLLFVLGAVVVVAVFWWGDDSLLHPSGTLFSQPRWLVLLFGLVTVPGLYFWGQPSRSMPSYPHEPLSTKLRRFLGWSTQDTGPRGQA
ncbi:hypothetical protein N802_16035 [Knoellia sinensis KCTC 19936]|uniref:DUF1129 domain-containing protein n=1 Tax=Knoellia sinensis KCTC 19936 TaxID=1385520 RepID=A0A0A0J6R9_9MICO|nr:hypothetical protein [Knoellia sinensis]KGN33015.1 hypothetical protein N802_16035 [Knoellia sinensis KCTC 19936]